MFFSKTRSNGPHSGVFEWEELGTARPKGVQQ